MVINVLKKSLGLEIEEIQQILENIVSDGVYLQGKHRVKGGGYLSLAKHLEEDLNLAPGVITDNYDLGHLVQLSLSDCFQDDESDSYDFFQELNNGIFSIMESFKNHKAMLEFEEMSNKLRDTTVCNKSYQATRWARNFLEGILAFLRNAGTFHQIYKEKLREAKLVKKGDEAFNEKIQNILSTIDQLEDAEFWMGIIGLWQIMTLVSKLSIGVQGSKTFPTTALNHSYSVLEEIDKLGTVFIENV